MSKAFQPPYTLKYRTTKILGNRHDLGWWELIDTRTKEPVPKTWDVGLGREIGGQYKSDLIEREGVMSLSGAPPDRLVQDVIDLNTPAHDWYQANINDEGIAITGKGEVITEDAAGKASQ